MTCFSSIESILQVPASQCTRLASLDWNDPSQYVAETLTAWQLSVSDNHPNAY